MLSVFIGIMIGFPKKIAQGKLKRASDCGGFGESLHTGGSITSSQHQANLAKLLGRHPTQLELFECTHKHKDQTWVDKRSEQFNVKFKNAKEELSQKAAEDGSGVQDERDTCARGQNGDFTLPEGAITRARAKKLKESFRNLATLIHEEMYQLLAKEEKIKPIGLNVEKPKRCLEIHWA
ncbi:hypothetical protein PIB30_104379 [Stylosanthes scabra]|uniref:Uncharacterized protein n=1 Tax=Stylosanthes scabra TaxID=79078 RepID=A0ABU6SZJ0_9FABA|nr:hypothetical protein [Stylosanthes scabra]